MSEFDDASLHSLADLHERNAREDMLALVGRAVRVAVRGALLSAPVAFGLIGVLAVAPAVVLPDIETVALAIVSMWSLLALFATALLAVRT
jgi:hypothetical protein